MTHLVRFGVLLALVGSLAPSAARAEQADLSAEKAFEQLTTYEYGQSRRALVWLELHVVRSAGDAKARAEVAGRLAAVLADPKATHAARLFACQQLAFVGADAQVPALVALLDDPQTVDMARRTLERIPGEAALEALRAALGRLKGRARVGVANSLGVRRDAQATGALATLLEDSDTELAAAAAGALGRIGSADAARALTGADYDAKVLPAAQDAALRCAEALVAAGDAAAAESIVYRPLWEHDAAPHLRVAALAGLVKTSPGKAVPLVVEAIGGKDPVLRGTAANLVTQMPGREVTDALVAQLASVGAYGRVLLVDALAARGDRAAGPAVQALLSAKDPALVSAAVSALAVLGGEDSVQPLCHAADAWPDARAAARTALARLDAPGVDARLLDLAARHDGGVQAEAVRALGARRTAGAGQVLLEAVDSGNERVSAAALEALAAAGVPDTYGRLVQRLAAAGSANHPEEIATAVVAVGSRIIAPAERAAPVILALGTAGAENKPLLLRVLASAGGPEAMEAVRGYLKDNDAAVRDAAVRALANWPDASAAGDLIAVARDSENATHRVLALRGYLRLAKETKDEAARLKMLEAIRPIATTPDAKKMLLAGLADVADRSALAVAEAFLDDADVKAEAALAVKKIQDAMKPKPGGAAAVPAYDKARSDALKAELAKRAPKGYHLACYLDCGPDTEDGAKGKPMLRVVGGSVHFWAGSDGPAPMRFGTVAYDGREVVFEAANLDPKRAYQVGFSWWDYDHDTRAQSVWVAGAKTELTKLLDKTPLPSGVKNEKPGEKTLAVPGDLSATGALRLVFRNESLPNAVISEIWLWESDASGPAPAAKPAPQAAAQPKRSEKQADTRVLIVTGAEYPGHPWQETAPALKALIEADARLAVDVVEDPNFLASPKLHDYAAIVQNWMNWEKPGPGPEARENFRKFVEGGKGLVLVHFACGAWQEWPEFRTIAGRAWDPKLRAHDPHGTFRVEIADPEHPITKGMKPFETVDELYTCLAGEAPLRVLATARSKVDGKDYPMAFVLNFGKGRVFHCVLGHDARALAAPGVAELYRRATAWAAGLAPVP